MANNNIINKDDLTEAARKAESLTTLLSDIELDFCDESDEQKIAIDFPRLRRYVSIAFQLSYDLTKNLHDNGIWCFDKEAVA